MMIPYGKLYRNGRVTRARAQGQYAGWLAAGNTP